VKTLSTCTSCGAPLALTVAEPFAHVELAAPLCRACTDRMFLAHGGSLLALRQPPDGALFPLGKITVTPGAIAALADAGEHAAAYLLRHVRGDWDACGMCEQIELSEDERRRGWEATEDGGKINKINLIKGWAKIMSMYETANGEPLWVITELEGDGGTTVLLPEER
jgi:hypothetical protein